MEVRFPSFVMSVVVMVILLGDLGAEISMGVSPRGGESGLGELERWTGVREPFPEDWPGGRVELIGESLGGAANWGSLAEYGVNFLEEQRGWAGFPGKERMEIAVPLFPDSVRVDEGMWRKALLNEVVDEGVRFDVDLSERDRFDDGGERYLEYFRVLGENLVRAGYGQSILRLGWEFNGTWFSWGTGSVGEFEVEGRGYDHGRAYREVFTAVRDMMASVEGAEFRFSWCVSIGAQNFVDEEQTPIDYERWFPTAGVVDFVSVDYFDDESRYYPGNAFEPSEALLLRLTWLSHLLRVEGIETSLAVLLERLGADMEGSFPWQASGIPEEKFGVLEEADFPTMESLRRYVLEEGIGKPGRPGVQWFRDLAEREGLGFLVSEWGVWENDRWEKPQVHFSGGDNAEYVRLFAEWLKGNAVSKGMTGALYYEEYNDLSRAGKREGFNHSLLRSFPKARKAYVEAFLK